MKKIILSLITIYQAIFSVLIIQLLGVSARCRFSISCSEYAKQSISTYGVLKGIQLSLVRLLHCQPFSKVSVSS